MNYIRKFKKNSKALSPVIASIILIAVTVAVSVVVAAWMGGMTIGLMGNAEQASITNVQFTGGANNQVTVTWTNSGTTSVTLQSAAIDGNTATLAATAGSSLTLTKGHQGTCTITYSDTTTFTSGTQYTIKLITSKGTDMPYTITAP
jgi:flagellin-like protein